MWSLLAQTAQNGDDWLHSLGPFVPFGVLAVGFILDQRLTIREQRATIEKVNHDLVATTERVVTELTKAAAVLAEVTHLLQQRREER